MKRTLLFIIVALFTVVSMNAQKETLIYEKNWEGVDYSEWRFMGYIEDPPIWSYYETTDEGLAITNPTVNDHIWGVRVMNGYFSLEEGHDYLVRLTIKLPSEGNIFMLLGSWSSSWYDTVPVTASDDWQVIDIESPNYYCDISDNAYVLLGLGEMVGTTILKKVQVYERTTQEPDTKPADDMAYRPFVEDGKVWKVGSTINRDDLVKMVEYYYFDGDTIIDGKTCKQMMRQRYVNPEYPDYSAVMQFPLLSYVGAWYEEDKKVYVYNATNKQFQMMYDLSVDANDTIVIRDYYLYVIGPRQTGGIKGFKGVYRDVITPGEQSTIYNTTWLEGVGGIDGPTVNVYYGKEGHAIFLMECAVGDEVIYLNDEYEDGATPEAARKRFDFTHTIKTKPQARTRSEEGQSLYGEYNDKQLGINLDPLDDAYQVRITDETGKVVYEKAINAGNVVGLNIDISSYAKGRYTVTVENSNESFTGEFDAQATGIAEVRSITKEASGPIYNLQGQRLSTLQKGLNIVNGQKVYVK